MKKILYTFIILSLFVLGLCSCDLVNTRIYTNKNELGYSMSSSDFTDMDEYRDNAIAQIDLDYDKFYNNYYYFSVYYFYLVDTMSETYVYYGLNGNSKYLTEYQSYYQKYQNYSKDRKNIIKLVANSTFKNKFFEGYTEEEILDLTKDTPDEVYTLEVEINNLQKEFQALSDNEMVTNGPKYIVSLVDKCNKLAKLQGYNNYLEYAYKEEYGRYYTYEDSLTFANYIKEYLIDYTIDTYNTLSSLKYSVDTYSYSSYISDTFTSNSKTLMKYAIEMGDEYLSNYKYLISKGYLYVAESGGYSGAYTSYYYLEDQPFMMLGDGYSSSNTFIHEFGHYLNAKINGWGETNYDLAETQSMGNEMIYTTYLLNNLALTSSTQDYLKLYKEYDMLYTLIECSYVNELTVRCFLEDNLTEERVVALHDEVLSGYGGSRITNIMKGLSNYPYYTIVPQPCYYISYSVAALEVLDLYKISLKDFNTGKSTYLSAVKTEGCSSSSDWLNMGLCDPFSEDSFKNLVA